MLHTWALACQIQQIFKLKDFAESLFVYILIMGGSWNKQVLVSNYNILNLICSPMYFASVLWKVKRPREDLKSSCEIWCHACPGHPEYLMSSRWWKIPALLPQSRRVCILALHYGVFIDFNSFLFLKTLLNILTAFIWCHEFYIKKKEINLVHWLLFPFLKSSFLLGLLVPPSERTG